MLKADRDPRPKHHKGRVVARPLSSSRGFYANPISKGVSVLWVAECCTVLRSRWCQSGINIASYSSDTVVHGSQAGSTCGRRRACAVEIRPFHEAFGHFIHVDLLAAYVFLDCLGVLYLSVSSTTRAELRLLVSGWRFESVHRGLRLRRGSAGYS